VKVHLEENGSDVVRAGVASSTIVVTSRLAYVEMRASLARRRREGHVSPPEHRRFVQEFEADWERYAKVEVSEALVIEAARLAELHRLRAYDAMHLASVLFIRAHMNEAPTFACWDRDLNAAAGREGLPLLRGA
jgi:uncharacterized protein